MEIAQIFVIGMVIGAIIELFIALLFHVAGAKAIKVHHRFSLFQKMSLFSIPVWGALALVLNNYQNYFLFFILCALIGPVLEYLAGRTFHRAFGIKLWTYKYGSIGKYTSFYAIPYWGGAGLFFFLLAKSFGV